MQSDNATEPWAHVVVAVVQPRQHPPGQPLRRRAVSERASALFVGLPLQAVGALAQTAQEYNPFALGRLYRKGAANARQPCFFPPGGLFSNRMDGWGGSSGLWGNEVGLKCEDRGRPD